MTSLSRYGPQERIEIEGFLDFFFEHSYKNPIEAFEEVLIWPTLKFIEMIEFGL